MNAESLPFMATVNSIPTSFPINVKVENTRNLYGYIFLSPIEFNIGKNKLIPILFELYI